MAGVCEITLDRDRDGEMLKVRDGDTGAQGCTRLGELSPADNGSSGGCGRIDCSGH